MRKKLSFIGLLLVGALLLSSCQPKIYGQTRRKKDRKCGCELIKQPKTDDLYADLSTK
jgi:hypothetical protein